MPNLENAGAKFLNVAMAVFAVAAADFERHFYVNLPAASA
jgi:hypothetical protein